jgi:hypothetical protein
MSLEGESTVYLAYDLVYMSFIFSPMLHLSHWPRHSCCEGFTYGRRRLGEA